MKGPLFRASLPHVLKERQTGERLDDIETLYTIIVEARRQQQDRGEVDERIALIALCFFGLPGKSARFREQVRTFRGRFRGVAADPAGQRDFRARLRPALLGAASPEDLPLDDISRLFDANEDASGQGSLLPHAPETPAPDVLWPDLRANPPGAASPATEQRLTH